MDFALIYRILGIPAWGILTIHIILIITTIGLSLFSLKTIRATKEKGLVISYIALTFALIAIIHPFTPIFPK
ncbi:MAG: hypothetical protein AAB482_04325 [Patescibacteria group bacterium]